MSPSTLRHPKGPSVQGTTSSSLGRPDAPSTSASPLSSFASTPTPSAMASPATVYSDRGCHRPPSQRQTEGHPPAAFVEFVPALPKGPVRFRPFEGGLDTAARRSIEAFHVFPFGSIEEYCRHIPYASGKKDFFDKTGREGFEVFQYVFRVPGDDKEYHVMWDYNVGLVRMTPFFKCCKYSKTTPAKMLNLNPGLRDITHSITGGSIMAQGYWMPYGCARAVCATFCFHIAGALVPIFGPDFPSECLPPQSPDYGRMVIAPALVEAAAEETELMRQLSLHSLDDDCKPLPLRSGGSAEHSHGLPPLADRADAHVPHGASLNCSRPLLRARSHDRGWHPAVSPAGGGPKLAPFRYPSLLRGALLPSPVEHERLPPLSHIAPFPPLPQPPPSLPPLILRHHRKHSLAVAHLPGPAPPWRSGEGPQDDAGGPREAALLAPFVGRPGRPNWSKQPLRAAPESLARLLRQDDALPPPPLPSMEHGGRRPASAIPNPGQGRACKGRGSGGVCNSNEQAAAHLAPFSCYPSPPRLPPLLSLDPETPWRRPPYPDSCSQPRTTSGRRKLPTGGGVTGPSPAPVPAPAWNATDVGAAELLVTLSGSPKAESHSRMRSVGDADTVPPVASRRPRSPSAARTKSERRFSASLSSILCDDSEPRKKRRDV